MFVPFHDVRMVETACCRCGACVRPNRDAFAGAEVLANHVLVVLDLHAGLNRNDTGEDGLTFQHLAGAESPVRRRVSGDVPSGNAPGTYPTIRVAYRTA